MNSKSSVRRSLTLSALILMPIFALAVPASGSGQQTEKLPARVMAPAQALGGLARGTVPATVIAQAFVEDRQMLRGEALTGNRHLYSDADRQELLDGLEQMAMGPLEFKARVDVFGVFRLVGLELRNSAPEAREISRRLLRIYNQTTDFHAKGSALRQLGLLLAYHPPEAQEIREILYNIARGADRSVTQDTGIQILLSGCQAALPTLNRLAREGIRSSDVTDVWFRNLAEGGFTIEEMEQYRWGEPCPTGGRGVAAAP